MCDLKKLQPLAPLHLPDAISIINVFRNAFPAIFQLTHFDTAFHKSMPFEARYYAIPRHLWSQGIVRYGFHGISCEYVYGKLKEQDTDIHDRNIIIAHLGSGSSITAIKDGRSVETTMGFSPTGGIMMGTRAGDIDPDVLIYLLKEKNMQAHELANLFNKESGIKAIADSDLPMEKLIQKKDIDSKAFDAIQMFSYHAKKQIGALAAAMSGLDIVVFTGGIGEHSPEIRQLICSNLEFLGISLDEDLNEASSTTIHHTSSAVKVHVIPTNEELVIAEHVNEYLKIH
jgi:acetate kinase